MGIPSGKRKWFTGKVAYRGTGQITDDAAERFGPEIAAVAERCGGVASPEAIVDAARRRGSALHDYIFQLSDDEAVQQHRLDQATYLVRHVVQVVVDEASGEEVQVRPFVHVEEERAAGYRAAASLADADYHTMRLERALNELRSFVRRFADLPETEMVTRMIRKVLAEHGEEEKS